MSWIIDLDGVMWRGHVAIDGSAEAVALLQAAGQRVVFVTNNSAMRAEGYAERLAAMGVSTSADDVIHGGHPVAAMSTPGDSVLLCGGDGLAEALAEAGVEVVDARTSAEEKAFSAVVIGWLPEFPVAMLDRAVRAVLAGARLMAPSADPLYPSAEGFRIGGGSLTAAVAYATKTDAVFAGKPYPAMSELVSRRVADIKAVAGDQEVSDGGLAKALGVPFVHVGSGVGDGDAPNLLTAVRRWLDSP